MKDRNKEKIDAALLRALDKMLELDEDRTGMCDCASIDECGHRMCPCKQPNCAGSGAI